MASRVYVGGLRPDTSERELEDAVSTSRTAAHRGWLTTRSNGFRACQRQAAAALGSRPECSRDRGFLLAVGRVPGCWAPHATLINPHTLCHSLLTPLLSAMFAACSLLRLAPSAPSGWRGSLLASPLWSLRTTAMQRTP